MTHSSYLVTKMRMEIDIVLFVLFHENQPKEYEHHSFDVSYCMSVYFYHFPTTNKQINVLESSNKYCYNSSFVLHLNEPHLQHTSRPHNIVCYCKCTNQCFNLC